MDILFDGVSINKEFDITLAERPVIPVAEREYESIHVPGRDGSLTRELGYKSTSFPLRFNFLKKDGVKQTFREISNWLTNKKILSFSDDLSVYRIITQINVNDAKNDIKEYADFVINLETEPFWYEDGGTQTITSNTTIINPTAVEVGVVMTIYGTGTCRVTVNDNLMIFTDVQGSVIVDGFRGLAHRNGVSQDNKMNGEYPKLKAGNNTIALSGATTKVEIEKRWSWR